MTEFLDTLPRTPASRLKPGDRGIGVIDLGDGQPFPIPVTVQHVTHEGAVVRDMHGREYLTRNLLAVDQDTDTLLEQQDKRRYRPTRRPGLLATGKGQRGTKHDKKNKHQDQITS